MGIKDDVVALYFAFVMLLACGFVFIPYVISLGVEKLVLRREQKKFE